MPQFEVVLKNHKIRSYRLLALFLVCFNLALLILLLVAHAHFYEMLITGVLVISYCMYHFYLYKKNNSKPIADAITFFVIAGCWLVVSNYLLALCCVLTGILYCFVSQKNVFIFNEDCIKKMNLPKANYSWQMLTNVILRDTILTLDFKNNKLLQAEIENDTDIDENVFNRFAQQHITSLNIEFL